MITVTPPELTTKDLPDTEPVEVSQEEYDEQFARLKSQDANMPDEDIHKLVRHVLCTHERPGKILPPGSITDPTQVANAFISNSAAVLNSLRVLHSAQVEEIRAVTTGLADVKNNFHADVDAATLKVQQASWDSDLKLTASAKSISDAIGSHGLLVQSTSALVGKSIIEVAEDLAVFSKDLCECIGDAETNTATRYKLSARDRWIQTGILAAGLFAVAGAILRGVL